MRRAVALLSLFLFIGVADAEPAAHKDRRTQRQVFRDALFALAGDGAEVVLKFDEKDGLMLLGAHKPVPAETTPPMTNLVLLERGADGSLRKIATGVSAAAYAPDGAILYVQGDALMESNAGKERLVTRPVVADFAVSPKGDLLAVARPGVAYQSGLELVTRKGENRRTLAKPDGTNSAPIFTPDGKSVVFVSGRTGVVSLFRIDVDGKNERQLTNRKVAQAPGKFGPDFVPPPISRRGMHFKGSSTLSYDAGDRRVELNVDTGKVEVIEVAR